MANGKKHQVYSLVFIFNRYSCSKEMLWIVWTLFKVNMKILVEMKSAGFNSSNYTEQFASCPFENRLGRCMIPYRTLLIYAYSCLSSNSFHYHIYILDTAAKTFKINNTTIYYKFTFWSPIIADEIWVKSPNNISIY